MIASATRIGVRGIGESTVREDIIRFREGLDDGSVAVCGNPWIRDPGVQAPTGRRGRLDPSVVLSRAIKEIRSGRIRNFTEYLPLLFHHEGHPYSLRDYFPFEPLYDTEMAPWITVIAGRQIAKSTNLALRSVLLGATIPNLRILHVTPLYEQIRKFSANYVKPFIEEAVIRDMLVSRDVVQNVLQKSFVNGSALFFSFCFNDATRIRGVSVDYLVKDERQSIPSSLMPVVDETMSGRRRFAMQLEAGTPLTLSGGLEGSWRSSSQAQFHVPCEACGKENIPTSEFDLDAMTGPAYVDREISEAEPAIVCAKCGKSIFPRENGFWVHHRRELRNEHPGYHMPQQIFPIHYTSPRKWAALLGKRAGFGGCPEYSYRNEVCGESFDYGIKLISQTELQRACGSAPNSLARAQEVADSFDYRVIAVDWGGGGASMTSYTVYALMGIRADRSIEVVAARRFPISHDYPGEAVGILHAWRAFRCHKMVHDFGGAGAIREQLLRDAGIPKSDIVPMAYSGILAGPLLRYKPEDRLTGQRDYHQVDKTRSLVLTCELIRRRAITFFAYDHRPPAEDGLIHDFLSLVDEQKQSRRKGTIYSVFRDELAGPDDFAHAVNLGALALFRMTGSLPDLADVIAKSLSEEQIAELLPVDRAWWQSPYAGYA